MANKKKGNVGGTDADDAPTLDAAFFDRATIFDGDRVVRPPTGASRSAVATTAGQEDQQPGDREDQQDDRDQHQPRRQ